MKAVVFVGMSFLLAACAGLEAGAAHSRGPNGEDTYALTCSGVLTSMDACVNKAAEKCPKGYTTLDGGPDATTSPVNRKEWFDIPDVNRHMTVQCK